MCGFLSVWRFLLFFEPGPLLFTSCMVSCRLICAPFLFSICNLGSFYTNLPEESVRKGLQGFKFPAQAPCKWPGSFLYSQFRAVSYSIQVVSKKKNFIDWFKQQAFILSILEAEKSKIKVQDAMTLGNAFSLGLVQSELLTVSSHSLSLICVHGERERQISLFFFSYSRPPIQLVQNHNLMTLLNPSCLLKSQISKYIHTES